MEANYLWVNTYTIKDMKFFRKNQKNNRNPTTNNYQRVEVEFVITPIK